MILLVITLSLFLNAILACIEMAFVSVSKAELTQAAAKGDIRAKRLLDLRQNPERTLSILQIGITLVGALSAAVGGAGAEEQLSPIFEQRLGMSEQASEIMSLVCVVIPITFLSVVVGELVPKTLALRNPLAFSLRAARWLQILDRLFSPLVRIFEISTKILLRLIVRDTRGTPAEQQAKANEAQANEELYSEFEGLASGQRQYVVNTVKLHRTRVDQVVVPWSEVHVLKDNMSAQAVREAILSSGHTRMPVVQADNEDTILGVLHTKECLAYIATGESDWRSIIRPTLYISSSDNLFSTLRLMQKSRNQLAIVTRPDSKLLGIMTLQGVFEEIIGDIYDEDDDGRIQRILANKQLRFSGITPKS